MFGMLLVIIVHLLIWGAGFIVYLSYRQDEDGFVLVFALLGSLIGLALSMAIGINAGLALALCAPLACFAAISARA